MKPEPVQEQPAVTEYLDNTVETDGGRTDQLFVHSLVYIVLLYCLADFLDSRKKKQKKKKILLLSGRTGAETDKSETTYGHQD